MDANRAFDLLLLAVVGLVAVLLLYQYLSVILAAILLAYLLDRPHGWLAPRIGDGPAAFGLLLATVILVVLPFVLLVAVAISGLADLAGRILGEDTAIGLSSLDQLLDEIFGTGFDLESSIREAVSSGQVMELLQPVLNTLGGLSEALIQLTILLFLTYYLLTAGDRLLAWVVSLVPLSDEDTGELFERADKLLYAVVIGSVAISIADGVLVGVGLWLTGFSNAIFWTLIAIFLAFIPLVGSMVVWIPAVVYLIATGDVVPGLLLGGYCVVIVGSMDNVMRPFVGAGQAGLNPALFIVGIFGGISLLGVMGIFYGPVLLALAKHVYDVVWRPYVDDVPRAREARSSTDEG